MLFHEERATRPKGGASNDESENEKRREGVDEMNREEEEMNK